MGILITSELRPRLAILAPPYHALAEVDTNWKPDELPPRGLMLIWWFVDAAVQEKQFDWLHTRPHGLPLTIVLPPAQEVHKTLPLLNYIGCLDPRGVLPAGRVATPVLLKRLLNTPPNSLAETVTRYLTSRYLLRSDNIREKVNATFSLSGELATVSALAKKLYISRRTLGRHFAREGLPVPSHWLQFARLLRVSLALQNTSESVGRAAVQMGYPDGFTLSNQMKRLLGIRPTVVRNYLGWEWIVETWLHREAARGDLDQDRYLESLNHYIQRDSSVDDPDGRCA